ncbi:MOSC domain-containing protein [Amaricoccus sp.]|uniref:MOSC domain-containing protein n=1 Tax=Amaricoccus sp. TaxID=1872485 RepID=UPI00260EB8F9|nr:MOSC domain-containing protein [Amaricoccus sp.]HRO11012.1 MOSC domain-containing protein [Amaricoccus sp.]
MQARVRALWRHPIKGHGVEAIGSTELAAGATMPWDRVWAIAHEAARLPGEPGAWAPCANFNRGAKAFQLMAIRAETDEAKGRVTLTHPRQEALTVDPDDPEDAARLVAWVMPLSNPHRALPARVVRADRGMTDSDFPSISLLNTAGLAALAGRVGRPLAQERFRGNVWLDGLAPFEEFDLVGREVRIGGATLRVRQPITRCMATTVDPVTGESDADTLGALRGGWGHEDFGVYAEVVEGGRIGVGDVAEAA